MSNLDIVPNKIGDKLHQTMGILYGDMQSSH